MSVCTHVLTHVRTVRLFDLLVQVLYFSSHFPSTSPTSNDPGGMGSGSPVEGDKEGEITSVCESDGRRERREDGNERD